MTYKTILIKHGEGYTVTVPALPGCISDGNTEAEALTNIKDVISEWLAYTRSELRRSGTGHREEGKELEDVYVAEVDVREPTLR